MAALALILAFPVASRAADDRALKSRVSPTYPELAKRMKITGTVKLEATVDAGGKVTAVKTVSGSRALSPAAEEAVSKWKYAPGDGIATVEVEVTFSLGQ
jgi:TonB family protein